ncbi:pseudouridine synthase [Thiomicrorhabdus sp. ZW0627]|uniref:pseudouridine synthase n=1 Tax=Thiomicrorhabdus sp. ZW0627 TaxID=3039774 RepID=UPI0024364B14|nr:pseudouridine synthase [Thiomicrorhabdus sp. ZW0627]MDG6774408.1 pseudouridine synthase [Thiomicrorhabdus sp. ZW0627]
MQTQLDLDAFKIVYQDSHLVAIHKPAGLLVHRSPIDKHETLFAVQLTRDTVGQMVYPIHRLDKATSGLLLFALDSNTARQLGQQFTEHTIEKTYLAICRGWTEPTGLIDKPLKYQKDRIADKLKKEQLEPQTAITAYKTLAHTTVDHTIGKFDQQRYSLVELKPKTGRKHQIRRHLNHISHPIIGDVKYGDRHHNHFFNEWLEQHRLYLAATSLQFIHPSTKETVTIEAPLEKSFQYAIDRLDFTQQEQKESQ